MDTKLLFLKPISYIMIRINGNIYAIIKNSKYKFIKNAISEYLLSSEKSVRYYFMSGTVQPIEVNAYIYIFFIL